MILFLCQYRTPLISRLSRADQNRKHPAAKQASAASAWCSASQNSDLIWFHAVRAESYTLCAICSPPDPCAAVVEETVYIMSILPARQISARWTAIPALSFPALHQNLCTVTDRLYTPGETTSQLGEHTRCRYKRPISLLQDAWQNRVVSKFHACIREVYKDLPWDPANPFHIPQCPDTPQSVQTRMHQLSD